jgi:hypothetical protein
MKQRDLLAVFVLMGDLRRWSYGRRRRGTPDPHAPKVHPFRQRNPCPRLGKAMIEVHPTTGPAASRASVSATSARSSTQPTIE